MHRGLVAEPDPARRRGWSGALVVVCAVFVTTTAATNLFKINLWDWRTSIPAAKSLVMDSAQPTPDRVQAVVVLQRDVRATVEMLRALEAGGGDVAAHAKNALDSIREAATR